MENVLYYFGFYLSGNLKFWNPSLGHHVYVCMVDLDDRNDVVKEIRFRNLLCGTCRIFRIVFWVSLCIGLSADWRMEYDVHMVGCRYMV